MQEDTQHCPQEAMAQGPTRSAAQEGRGLQDTREVLTISMMRCPHTLHLSAVCWNPEY